MNTLLNALRERDPSFTEDMAKGIRAIYEGSADAGGPSPELILSREEVGYIINSSVDTVDLYCRKEWLKKIKPDGASRAIGISAKSVSDFSKISLANIFETVKHFRKKEAA